MEPARRIPELRPEIVFLFDLVKQLVAGRIRIPRFQRPFVWRRDQMIDLLDSINRQYPIGSLLAWETDADIVSLSSIGPISVTKRNDKSTVYLLDGHQRLSTIAGALVASKDRAIGLDDDDPGRWNLYYNALDERFEQLERDDAPQPYQFPMSKILDTFDFLDECQRVLDGDRTNGRLFVERIQDVARAFQNYKIPIIQIKQTGLTEAVEIFARLNSKGQAMTADQMVSALLYRQGEANPFDLANEISESMAILQSHGFGGVDRTLVLRALLAAAGEDIYRTDWTRIAQSRREELLEKLRPTIPSVNASLEAAIRFFKSELGVFTDRLLPYAMQMMIVSSLFLVEPKPSAAQTALLRRWFWVSSFSGWFGGANPSRVNALVRDVIDKVAPNRANPIFSNVDLSVPAMPIPRSFDMRSARTRTLLLVFLSLTPRGRNGKPIVEPEKLISLHGPEAVGYVASTVRDRELARSPANRMLRDDPEDRGQSRNWLLNCSSDIREEVWASHAIPTEATDLLSSSDGSEFLRARLKRITDIERKFMENRGVIPPQSEAPAAAPIDSD